MAAMAQTNEIVWEKDFKKAQAMARETGKPMLLDFTAPWCKPCQAMDRDFWVLDDVIKATKSFIMVKINYDDEKKLVSRYNVAGIPFVAFTDPLGDIVTFRLGFGGKKASEINAIIKDMPTDFTSLKAAYEAIDANKEDGQSLLKIADFYRSTGMLKLSNEYYKRALKTPEIKSDAEKSERISSVFGFNAYGYNDYKAADKYLDEYLKLFPTGKYREVSLAILSISNAKLYKFKEAEKYLESLKKDFPASKYIQNAVNAIETSKLEKDKK